MMGSAMMGSAMMGSAMTIAANEDATGSQITSLGRRGSSIETEQLVRLADLTPTVRGEAPGSPYLCDEFLAQFSGLTADTVVDVPYMTKVSYASSPKRRTGDPDRVYWLRPRLEQLQLEEPAFGHDTTPAEAATESDADLEAALADLGEVAEEAREQGFPEPSRETINLADRLLRGMYRTRPCLFGVYPTQDGEVTIHAVGRLGSSVRVLCHAADGVICLVNLDGQQHRRGVYMPVATSSASLRNFVQEALDDIGSER